MSEHDRGLGRTAPPDFEHIDKYPAVRMAAGPETCERTLTLSSRWRKRYHQRNTPRCVGYSSSQERSISERLTFDPDWLYAECKKRDGIPHIGGTYLRVAYDVLREQGHVRVKGRAFSAPDSRYGVERNEWARNVDEIRRAIEAGKGVVVGTNWYRRMFRPEPRQGMYWLPEGSADLGRNDGGHAYLLNRVSDRYEAFATPNTWGQSDRDWTPDEEGWPVTMVPYSLMARLLAEDGEAVLVVDRVQP